MFTTLKQKVMEKIEQYQMRKANELAERNKLRQLFVYFGDYNTRSTMWQKNEFGDRVRNKHKWS
jgi:predicted membrane protein